jgi:hypothetical protein
MKNRGIYLHGGKVLFVCLPLHTDAVAWFCAISGLLLSSLVCKILLCRLLWVKVTEPLRKLLKGGGKVKCVWVRWCTTPTIGAARRRAAIAAMVW